MKKRVFNLIIVDESGSMHVIRKQAFSGMNETLQTIKAFAEQKQDIEQRVTLITFDSEHTKFHYNNADGLSVVPLREGDYQPGGCTPLYDAIGAGIAKVNAHTKEGDSVLVTIITDGYENASREYNLSMVKNLINKLKEQNWTFTFIGTDDLDRPCSRKREQVVAVIIVNWPVRSLLQVWENSSRRSMCNHIYVYRLQHVSISITYYSMMYWHEAGYRFPPLVF